MAAPDLGEPLSTPEVIDPSSSPKGNTKTSPRGGVEGASPSVAVEETSIDDEVDLSDITHNPVEMSREDIIAAAEAAAYSDLP